MKAIIKEEEIQSQDLYLPQLQLSYGIWVNGNTYWLHNQTEKVISKEKLTVKIKQEYIHSKIRNSYIYITNHGYLEKEIKLIIMHRYLKASMDHLSFISPSEQVIFHLANKKVFLVNGYYEGQPIQQATIQPFWKINTEQFWNSSEKGTLIYQPMAKGVAVSLFTFNISIPPNETKRASTWTIQGETKKELLNINQTLLKNTLAFPFKK